MKASRVDIDGEEIRVLYDPRQIITLHDPDGLVRRLLRLLAEGVRSPAELAADVSGSARLVGVEEVVEAVRGLDELGLIDDASEDHLAAADRLRFKSNLAFFEAFASLGKSSHDWQDQLRQSHVLVLGGGGLGSNTLQNLCGMGIGRLTLLDFDQVAPENFARQFLYRWSDIGTSKIKRAAAWVAEFDPAISVRAVERQVTGPHDVEDLLPGVDVVVSGIDKPVDIDRWVNAACVAAGVPWIRGGMFVTQGICYSVDPGRSACIECLTDPDGTRYLHPATTRWRGLGEFEPVSVNRGIAPVASLLGSLAGFEVLRYLTRFEEPALAGRFCVIDFANGCQMTYDPWKRRSDCPVCSSLAGSVNPGSV